MMRSFTVARKGDATDPRKGIRPMPHLKADALEEDPEGMAFLKDCLAARPVSEPKEQASAAPPRRVRRSRARLDRQDVLSAPLVRLAR
jgi:hypothetical protein